MDDVKEPGPGEQPAPALPSGLRLRPAVTADSPAVRALVFQVLGEYGLQPSPATTDADLADVERAYAGSGGWFVVVEAAEGGIVGCAGLLPRGDGDVELRKMHLDRRFRGRGVGRALLAAALVEARRRGFAKVSLETATVLKEAVRLYEAHGFRRREGPFHACRCDLAMELDLQP